MSIAAFIPMAQDIVDATSNNLLTSLLAVPPILLIRTLG